MIAATPGAPSNRIFAELVPPSGSVSKQVLLIGSDGTTFHGDEQRPHTRWLLPSAQLTPVLAKVTETADRYIAPIVSSERRAAAASGASAGTFSLTSTWIAPVHGALAIAICVKLSMFRLD
eukprot:SAG31_NODE_21952_length_537_cov_0.945205_1_plen_121_part_00